MRKQEVLNKNRVKHKILTRISKLKDASNEFNSFLNSLLNSNIDVFIIGGFIRSLIEKKSPRDIDLIINASQEYLQNEVNLTFKKVSRNKFDGFKIKAGSVYLDVWSLEKNLGTKNIKNIKRRNIIKEIAESTFLNYDSLVINLKNNKLHLSNYENCLTTGIIDLTKNLTFYNHYSNSIKKSCLIRTLYISEKYNFGISQELLKFIYNVMHELESSTESDSIKSALLNFTSDNKRYKNFFKGKKIEKKIDHLIVDLKNEGDFYENSLFGLMPQTGLNSDGLVIK